MISYTTPTFVLTVPAEACIDQATSIYFTIQQDDFVFTKNNLSAENNVVTVSMSQAESGVFHQGKAKIQLNWLFADGTRAATKKKTIEVENNLLGRVVE